MFHEMMLGIIGIIVGISLIIYGIFGIIVIMTSRDHYKNLVEPENSFVFEANLPDGMRL